MKSWFMFLLGIIFSAAVVVGIGYIAVETGAIPANADASAPALERWAARTSLRATLRRAAESAPSPPPMSDADLLAGVKLYAANCIICHGTSSGASTTIAHGVYQRPPRFGRPHPFAHDEPGAIAWQIRHGIRWTAMPSFGAALSDQQIWQLTMLLKNLGSLSPPVQQAWSALREPAGMTVVPPPSPTPAPAS